MSPIKDAISKQLSREVNDRLVDTVMGFFKAGGSVDDFVTKCMTLGIKDGHAIYQLIANQGSKPRRILAIDDDEDIEEVLKVRANPKKLSKFKKMDKSEARRRNESYHDTELEKVEVIQEVKQDRKKIDSETGSNKMVLIPKGIISSPIGDTSRLQVVAHFYVPPFLSAHSSHLSVNLEKVGPIVDPVRNEKSELAVEAKEGSRLVMDRRSNKERQKKMEQLIGKEDKKVETVIQEAEQGDEDVTKTRQSLPVYQVREKLVQVVMENQVTVIIGETGSGKTTQLAQYLFEYGVQGKICCTQPRRVAAISVAKRVAEEVGCSLGSTVGYSVRFDDCSTAETKIRFMTDGILLREVLSDPLLSSYDVIIMDEAHERSLNTDILLGIFKRVLTNRKDLKVVITSATMNAARFSEYFGGAPQFFIPGRTFPVEVMYAKSSTVDYVESAVKQVLNIHLSTNKNDGDILVFMTGQEDIEAVCETLAQRLEEIDGPPPLAILPIYSSLPPEQQRRIFAPFDQRKVVVATNIAETSLTIDGIKYVIDSGLVKMNVYSAKLGMNVLRVVPESLANANQRSGRAGRTGPGIAYRLYTERASSDEMMFPQPIPEIQRTNLSNVMLLLKSSLVTDVGKFPFLDPPPPDLLFGSLYDLWTLGALDHLGNLTFLGKIMTDFPLEPALSRALIMSAHPHFGCSIQVVTIVAILAVGSSQMFLRPKERAQEADSMREKFIVPESDHLTLLNLYNQWKNQKHRESWSSKNFVNSKQLQRATDIRQQLVGLMNSKKLAMVSGSDGDVRRLLCAAFFSSAAQVERVNPVSGSPEFSSLRQRYMKLFLHPTSVLIGANLSTPYVIYHSLMLTTKEYISCVTSVDPLWLIEYGGVYYDASDIHKRRYHLQTWDMGKELAQVTQSFTGEEEVVVKKPVFKRRRL